MTRHNKSINERGQKKVVTVLVFGTFDILHPGHLYFLREAKKHGDHLTVVVTPSVVVKQLKGKAPMFGEAHRVATVKLMSFVDQVLIGDRTLSTFDVLKKSKPDVICFGYDQRILETHLKKWYAKQKKLRDNKYDDRHIYCRAKFVRVRAYNPQQYKSGRLKKLLSGEEVCLRCRI